MMMESYIETLNLGGMPGRLKPGLHARRVVGLISLLWLLVLCVCQAQAEVSHDAFDAANKLYEQGKFLDAASAYEKLLQSGRTSAALFFNLGNAYFKGGQIGRAIAEYRRAEQIAPRDSDLRANLQFARKQIQGPTLASSRRQDWLGKLNLNEWSWLASGAVWLWLLLLTVREWRPALKPVMRGYTLAAGIGAALLCVGLASLLQLHSQRVAIVVDADAIAHQAPVDESPTAFTVHDGAELDILDQKDDWLQVSVDARKIGWLHRAKVSVAPKA
jgi:tetratricopeptide (TPR) repeat protein